MASNRHKPAVSGPGPIPDWLGGAIGVVMALAVLKFGNPVVLAHRVSAPGDIYQALVQPWPLEWGFAVLLAVVLCALLFAGRFQTGAPRWLLWAPLAWLGWQFVSATNSVDPRLTAITLKQFAACVAVFYLGIFVLARIRNAKPFWMPLVIGFFLMLAVGFSQRFGSLEQTRQYVEQHEKTGWRDVPAEQLRDLIESGLLIKTAEGYSISQELMKRIQKGRVFATMGGYPNALAAVILLLLPGVTVWTFQNSVRLSLAARSLLAALIAAAGLACLYWSGSKTGWLVALAMGFVALLQLPFKRSIKLALVTVLMIAGLTGFYVKYASYFEKGATSVSARFQYWQAAWKTALENPVLGTGPGTFSHAYKRLKSPEAEMAQLVHNDYLEQASDSGWIGFAAYLVWTVGGVAWLYFAGGVTTDKLRFAVWLGLFGWALQEAAEFGLFIPAVAWPAFLLFGWLRGTRPRPS